LANNNCRKFDLDRFLFRSLPLALAEGAGGHCSPLDFHAWYRKNVSAPITRLEKHPNSHRPS